jgi:hypothetical protein
MYLWRSISVPVHIQSGRFYEHILEAPPFMLSPYAGKTRVENFHRIFARLPLFSGSRAEYRQTGAEAREGLKCAIQLRIVTAEGITDGDTSLQMIWLEIPLLHICNDLNNRLGYPCFSPPIAHKVYARNERSQSMSGQRPWARCDR